MAGVSLKCRKVKRTIPGKNKFFKKVKQEKRFTLNADELQKRKYSAVQFSVALPRMARQKMRSFCNIIKASKVKLLTTKPCLKVLGGFINPSQFLFVLLHCMVVRFQIVWVHLKVEKDVLGRGFASMCENCGTCQTCEPSDRLYVVEQK